MRRVGSYSCEGINVSFLASLESEYLARDTAGCKLALRREQKVGQNVKSEEQNFHYQPIFFLQKQLM